MPDLDKDVKQIVDELREKAEKFGAHSAEFKAFEEKTTDTLQKQEAESQKLVKEIAEANKRSLDIEDQLKGLEVEMARKADVTGISYKKTDEYKALNLFASKGMENLAPEQKALLRSDSDTAGGYLTSSEMDNAIIKKVTEISPVRQVARVRTISKKTLEMPKREGILEASYEGETEAASDSTSNYGAETVTTFALTVNLPFTYDMILSSDFDIEAEINQDVSEAFAQKEGNKFVLGTGSKQPEGFLVNAAVVAGARETANSGTITGNDIINLTGDLKVGYKPMYGFNRQTLAFLRTLQGGDGQYLWQIGLGGGAPNQLAGEPYMVMQDIPSIAAGALSVVYADFARGYTIVDRTGLAVIRDDVTRKKNRIVEWCFHKYNTGQVTLAEAFKALKIKA